MILIGTMYYIAHSQFIIFYHTILIMTNRLKGYKLFENDLKGEEDVYNYKII